jgi:Mg-chelatase subunit ChlD
MAYANSSPAMQYPSAPSAPPSNGVSYNTLATAEERMQKFAQLAGRHEINQNFAARLRQLEGYEIVFLCDDSGSMATGVGKFYQLSRFFQFYFYLFRRN